MSDTLTGNDTFTLFDRVLRDFGDGDVAVVSFPNDSFSSVTGKNGNAIYSQNQQGRNVDVELRILLGSSDDAFLQQKYNQRLRDFTGQPLISGEFVKLVGDGLGGLNRVVYTLNGGHFMRNIDARDNQAGDTSQAVAVFRMKFSRGERSIQ